MKKTKLEKIEAKIKTLKAQKKSLEKENANKIAKAIIKNGFGSMPIDRIISKLKGPVEDTVIVETQGVGGGKFSKFLSK